MAIHIRDPETDVLVRRLAGETGVGLTEAIKLAVGNELKRRDEKVSLREKLAPLQAEVLAMPSTGLKADKAFYDWLSGEDDE